jgi:NTP pyrophosphatase (non-canonical NTP hydrolase)
VTDTSRDFAPKMCKRVIPVNKGVDMTLDEYQKKAMTTELMKRSVDQKASDPAFVAKILGLVGEAGEVAEKFKKIIRDMDGEILVEDRLEIRKELGDVLWYIAALSDYLGFSLEEVGQKNIDKLLDRKARGVSGGSGDNR